MAERYVEMRMPWSFATEVLRVLDAAGDVYGEIAREPAAGLAEVAAQFRLIARVSELRAEADRIEAALKEWR